MNPPLLMQSRRPASLQIRDLGTEPCSDDIPGLKIVEVGDKPFMKRAFPDQVAYFSTRSDADATTGSMHRNQPEAAVSALWRALGDPATSLVVCHPAAFSPWHWRWLARTLFDRRAPHRLMSLPRSAAPQLLRRRIAAPIAIVDHEDLPIINRNNFFLLDRCRVYFKRELPPDRWRLFLKTGHANLPTPRFRNIVKNRFEITKLRPISLGLPLGSQTPSSLDPSEKSTDIFFSGKVEGSSFLRPRGLSELMALHERGVVIDFAEKRLEQSEFYKRCARAWLTWSPEGLGWDCFRHYEAAACGSVPLSNQPTIERYRPLLHGEHAIYYDAEEGGLTKAVVAALADKQHLAAMARAARAHVLSHHTPAAIARYIVRTSLTPLVGC